MSERSAWVYLSLRFLLLPVVLYLIVLALAFTDDWHERCPLFTGCREMMMNAPC